MQDQPALKTVDAQKHSNKTRTTTMFKRLSNVASKLRQSLNKKQVRKSHDEAHGGDHGHHHEV